MMDKTIDLVMVAKEDKMIEEKKKKKIIKKQVDKFNCCASFYMYLHKWRINHIFFLSEVEECSRIKKDMQFGKRKI